MRTSNGLLAPCGDDCGFAVLFRYTLHLCLECLETGLGIAELHQRFLCVLVVAPVKCPRIVGLTSHINSSNQSFLVMDAIFVFCVLQFILDTSLFNKILLTDKVSNLILL